MNNAILTLVQGSVHKDIQDKILNENAYVRPFPWVFITLSLAVERFYVYFMCQLPKTNRIPMATRPVTQTLNMARSTSGRTPPNKSALSGK